MDAIEPHDRGPVGAVRRAIGVELQLRVEAGGDRAHQRSYRLAAVIGRANEAGEIDQIALRGIEDHGAAIVVGDAGEADPVLRGGAAPGAELELCGTRTLRPPVNARP